MINELIAASNQLSTVANNNKQQQKGIQYDDEENFHEICILNGIRLKCWQC